MKLKIHTANSVDMVECILIKKICESKNSYVYECKINDEYFNDNIYIIKILKTMKYDYLKEYSYLNKVNPYTNLHILGTSNIKSSCINETNGYNYKCVIMNKINGITLKKLLLNNNYEYSFNDYCIIYNEIIKRINLMHRQFIFHNDVKAHNILIDKYYNTNVLDINIIDFGECMYYINNELIATYYINNNNMINFVNAGFNDILIANKYLKQYMSYFRLIDKFNIFIDIFKRYYEINTTKGRIDKLNEIMIISSKLGFTNKKLLKFIFEFNITSRLNIPCFMMVLHNNKLLNKTVVDHIKKLYSIINSINNYDLLKEDINNITLYHYSIKHLNKNDFLLTSLIYYSIILYNRYNTLNPDYFITYNNYYIFIEQLMNMQLRINNNKNNIDFVLCKILNNIK